MRLDEATQILTKAGFILENKQEELKGLHDIKDWFAKHSDYEVLLFGATRKEGKTTLKKLDKTTYTLKFKNTPFPTDLTVEFYGDEIYIAANGDRFATKNYKFKGPQTLEELLFLLSQCYDNLLDENTKFYEAAHFLNEKGYTLDEIE